MGSGPSRGRPNRLSHSRARKPVKRLWPFNCCRARICVTPMMTILPNDEKKWKRNFRFRYLLLSHASLQTLEAYLLTLSYRDFQNSYEWEKFQLWLQEVLYKARWVTEGPVEMASSESLCACLLRKRPRRE